MKRFFGLIGLACLAACGLHAQAVDTTVCNVLKDPASFNGKTVRIKGTVRVSYDQFVIEDGDCGQSVNGIWLDYPAGTKAKSGPFAVVELQPARNFAGKAAPANPAAVTLTRDKEFKQFDSELSKDHHISGGICMGCFRSDVQATLTGRLDSVSDAGIQRNNGKIVGLGGFGNVNAYPARLVIESVSDVKAQPVDYSKVDDAVKKANAGPPQQSMFTDPLDTAQKIVAAMGPSPITTQMASDVALLGKPNENKDGVVITYGDPGTLTADEGSPSATDSSDGVQYNCRFNRDKLQDLALSIAMLHAAQHVEDVRSAKSDNLVAPLAIQENNAWAVSATAALNARQRLFVLPGGYIMWNLAWPEADRVNNMESALNDFLSKEEMLSK